MQDRLPKHVTIERFLTGDVMEITVLKFGGTSIQNRNNFKKALQHIQHELAKKHKIVCVVSAMGRLGDPYATDTLKQLVSYQISKKEQDRLLSVGEIISSIVFSDFLLSNGIRSRSLSTKETGIITDDNFTNANIIGVDDEYILKTLETHDVVVVPGFQGITIQEVVTTIGRGGSDLTAIALGVKLKALYVDIVSDVDGIMTADPKLVNKAKRISELSYDTLIDMSKNGAQVIHYKAAIMAKRSKIKLRFISIDNLNSYTEIVDEKTNTINITYKYGYVKYTTEFNMKKTLLGHFVEAYKGDFYVCDDNVDVINEFLENQNIKFLTHGDYIKITLINHHNELVEQTTFTDEEHLVSKLNSIHDTISND